MTGLKNLVDTLLATPIWHTVAKISAALLVVGVFIKPVVSSFRWMLRWWDAKGASALETKTTIESFTDAEISEAVRHYIEPDATNVDPANEDDLRNFAFVREDIFSALDRTLESPDKVYLMVLADSGMGKTTLFLNFYARERARPKARRREIAVIPLGRSDADEQIKNISNKRTTILLLDALDEDIEAIKDHGKRLRELMDLSADFKAVIVSCRTQFFSSDQALPSETGIARVAPKRAGATGTHLIKRFYLAPFNETQVEAYIKAVIPFYRIIARRRAHKLINRIPELAVRPMLLALLPDLLSNMGQFREIWDLYEFMVQSWLSRESNWISPQDLLNASERVAVEVYLGRQLRQSERLPPEEFASLLSGMALPLETWKLKARSLLNRDAAGHYKFAHRSIMEFLFIRSLVGGDDRCANVQWTDMMCELFLSWGRSEGGVTAAGQKRAKILLEGNGLLSTGLFPLVSTANPASRIDVQWAQRALGMAHHMRERAGIPVAWRKWTSRLIRHGNVVRLYDFSEGIVWQFAITSGIADKGVYREPPIVSRGYTDGKGRLWGLPTLIEFRSFVETASAYAEISLDIGEFYWLADADTQFYSIARLRDISREAAPPATFRNGATFLASAGISAADHLSLDVYSRPKIIRNLQGYEAPISVECMVVATLRCDAHREWDNERGEPLDGASHWVITKLGSYVYAGEQEAPSI